MSDVVIDLDPLLETLNKLSGGRVLRAAEIIHEGEFTRARIPVRLLNTGDKVDIALRRYASDWVKLRCPNHASDTRFEKLPAGTSYFQGGKETPITGAIVLSWWPRPEVPDFEQIKRMQQARKGTSPEGG